MSEELKNNSESTENNKVQETSLIPSSPAEVAPAPVDLSKESLAIIEKIVSENDEAKTKELTYLFNVNQNKKTMVRVNKLNDLLDTITDQALTRFTNKPDEISNKELFDGLKVVQDLIERGQKQVSTVEEAPLIQVNQQTNEVNIGGENRSLNRDSREKVKTAVLGLLSSLSQQQPTTDSPIELAVDTEEEDEDDQ